MQTEIRVSSMDDVVPHLKLPNYRSEAVLEPPKDVVEEIQLPVSIVLRKDFPFIDVLQHLDCCLSLRFNASAPNDDPVQHCVQASASVSDVNVLAMHFSLFQIPVGEHHYTFHLRNRLPPHTEYSAESVQGVIEVRAQEEFQPSYEWAPLRAWHTIPHGLQTR